VLQVFNETFPPKRRTLYEPKHVEVDAQMFSFRPLRSIVKISPKEKGPVSHRTGELSSTSDALDLVPRDLAEKLLALPLQIKNGRLLIATTREGARSATEALRFACSMPVEVLSFLPHKSILEAVYANYYGCEERLQKESRALRECEPPAHLSLYELEARDEKSEIPRFLTALFDYALTRNASDIHISPRREGTFIRLRVGGALLDHHQPICSPLLHPQLVQRIKILSELDPTIKHLALDGSFSFPTPIGATSVRVSTMPTIHGEKVVLRLMGQRGVLSLGELGLSNHIHEEILSSLERHQGAVVVSGATGSGKSTTLYGVLKHTVERDRNVVSLEDPVEQVVDGVSQTAIDVARGFGYPEALRSVLRQDPDVIMIGEMRDSSSATIAINAALTGHIVLSTMHGGAVLEVLHRFRQLQVDVLTLSQALSLIVCQRLIPKLCSVCKVLDLTASNEMKSTLYRQVGCSACDYTGFNGVVVAAEHLRMVPEIRKRIADGGIDDDLLKEASQLKAYCSMKSSLLSLARSGTITIHSLGNQ